MNAMRSLIGDHAGLYAPAPVRLMLNCVSWVHVAVSAADASAGSTKMLPCEATASCVPSGDHVGVNASHGPGIRVICVRSLPSALTKNTWLRDPKARCWPLGDHVGKCSSSVVFVICLTCPVSMSSTCSARWPAASEVKASWPVGTSAACADGAGRLAELQATIAGSSHTMHTMRHVNMAKHRCRMGTINL